MIFPEIREAYNAKIKNPMDLTTAEAKLLSGVYVYAEEVSANNLDVTCHKQAHLTTFSCVYF